MNYRKSEAKEAAFAQFRGIWAAITTPFTPDGALDEAGLRHNIRYFTDRLGVDGIFCTGTMGEFWALTKEERIRTVEIVVEEARGKCRVIAHTGHHSPNETVDLTQHAQAAGADFAIVINPYYPAANDDMIYEWFAFVASRVDIGIWMFDTSYAGYGFSPQLTARIADIENVCGIKCSRPLEHYAQVRKLCGEKIVMSHPSEAEWLTLMRDHGARVHMSSAAPFLLQTATWRPLREYTELGLQGRFAEAETASRQLDPLREVHERWMRDPWVKQKIIPIAYLKAWTEMLGLAAGPVRPPLLQITGEERQALREDLEKTGLLARASMPHQARAA
ncbi:MAG: dihydrodipicolinate synthase family protein [Betaproteobacteria bacterium]|nr:dihydrodipicolinate synthase family protein [Betaproteobacteria bacterium]